MCTDIFIRQLQKCVIYIATNTPILLRIYIISQGKGYTCAFTDKTTDDAAIPQNCACCMILTHG